MSEGDGTASSKLSEDFNLRASLMEKLPLEIKRRVRALKKLQYETVKVDVAFYKELFELEMKYDVEHQRIFNQRKAIVNGEKEPDDNECDWPSDDEHPTADGDDVDKLCNEVDKKAIVMEENNKGVKGIPEFWLQTMRNVSLLDEMIQEHDVKILKHLTDVECKLHSDEPGFTLEFHFSQNEFFTNKVLTKRYFFNYDISPDEPFEYEGPEIVSTKGCVINWNPGKNVTVKVIKKVQKKKGGQAKRTITKNVQEDSFFNFFDPPALKDLADFKLGQFIRDSIVPRAVLFFTGEEVAEDSDDEDGDEDEDDDDEEEEDEEDAEVSFV
ncbi:Nucleosome assembly protein 1 [Paragonimus heterotremus]|uniref:Nucleosome assembly protein 1 n=1 Tax=Paragonimus heterotremus TaxID=100268 RepID=A0A8J4SJY4_9TREM|nr:Nucleosome assembly protein 1 [Paragonimus heterotremus]